MAPGPRLGCADRLPTRESPPRRGERIGDPGRGGRDARRDGCRRAPRLRRLIRDRDVSLVHTHSSVDSWLAGIAAKSLGRRVVRSRHVSIPIRRRRALVYRLADRVITSGEAVRSIVIAAASRPNAWCRSQPESTATRFHAGVSGQSVRQELGLGEAPVVGLVANVRGSKGHNFFLEAARTVLASTPDARFLIVGDGVGLRRGGARVREMGLDASVRLTGFRRDIPEVMAALDVLVLPSIRSEAIPQVIPQALAVGTPVVGLDRRRQPRADPRRRDRPPRAPGRSPRPRRGDPGAAPRARARSRDGAGRTGAGAGALHDRRDDGSNHRGVPRYSWNIEIF